MRVFGVSAIGLACTLLSATGHTQGAEVVRPVPGYICMLLSPQDEQATVPSELPPIFAEPSATAVKLGYPTQIALVKWPMHAVSGYVEVLRGNGQAGWIDARHLRPWHPMNNTNASCVPSLMANGRIGTDIH
jgi:hypothetical protein